MTKFFVTMFIGSVVLEKIFNYVSANYSILDIKWLLGL